MHRIAFSPKCRNLHGHRYTAFLTVQAKEDMDLEVVKTQVNNWLDANWDHTGVFDKDDDHPAIAAISEMNAEGGRPVYFLDGPPTCENLCEELARVSNDLLKPHGATVVRVQLWETPNIFATWEDPAAAGYLPPPMEEPTSPPRSSPPEPNSSSENEPSSSGPGTEP